MLAKGGVSFELGGPVALPQAFFAVTEAVNDAQGGAGEGCQPE